MVKIEFFMRQRRVTGIPTYWDPSVLSVPPVVTIGARTESRNIAFDRVQVQQNNRIEEILIKVSGQPAQLTIMDDKPLKLRFPSGINSTYVVPFY